MTQLIVTLLGLSVLALLVPVVILVVGKLVTKPAYSGVKKAQMSPMLLFSVCMLGSVWCLRYAVGYYTITATDPAQFPLTWWEEIFNSMVHTLKTFSMDEDYTQYILDGKQMLRQMFGENTLWQTVYSLYASILNFAAPVAGGAIILDVLASVFPKIRLFFSGIAIWREKYYFSELNDASLALARSIAKESSVPFKKPMLIFTDAYADDDDEKGNELLQGAKALGAVCVKDDLLHVAKSVRGKRTFFLIDAKPIGNLQTLADLSDGRESSCLKDATVYLFSENDLYTRVEGQVRESLLEHGFAEEELPLIVPVLGSRNLVTNLLVDYPLYEPLIGKKAGEDGKKKLKVTVLGSGSVGTETFLSVYWFGQMLDTDLQITVVSKESEPSFRGRINGVNPEILRTAE